MMSAKDILAENLLALTAYDWLSQGDRSQFTIAQWSAYRIVEAMTQAMVWEDVTFHHVSRQYLIERCVQGRVRP